MNAFRPRQALLSLALVLVLPGSPPLEAADNPGFVIIVNEACPLESVSREELARVFLKKTAKWANGLSATPVDQVEGSPVREAFSRGVLKKDAALPEKIWIFPSTANGSECASPRSTSTRTTAARVTTPAATRS